MEKDRLDREKLLHRYLNGTASPEEIALLKADPEFESYVKIAEASSGFETPGFEQESNFDKLQKKLTASHKVRPMKSWRILIRGAAAAVLIFVGYLLFRDPQTTITTQIAQKQEFQLPDASRVYLNAQSEISYTKNKWPDERLLELTGEAYFKVEKGKTFRVQTPLGIVRVLGTQFNVFSRDSIFSVKCYEGLVSVQYSDTTLQVPAGIQVEIRNEKKLLKTSHSNFSPNWITNESTFENVSLSLVLEELKRQYPISITTQPMVNQKFTGSFTHTDLRVALRSICDPLQMDFTIAGEEVTLHAKKNN